MLVHSDSRASHERRPVLHRVNALGQRMGKRPCAARSAQRRTARGTVSEVRPDKSCRLPPWVMPCAMGILCMPATVRAPRTAG